MGVVTVNHPREVWQSASQPVYSTSLFEWSDVDRKMLHYTAAMNLPDGDPGENALQLPQYLRNMQNWYLTRTGG